MRMTTTLYCTLCGNRLSLMGMDEDSGANLECENGHKFYYSPAYLEKGDILVIGDVSFQCANDAPYEELLPKVGDLKVWNVINPPRQPTWHPVKSPDAGALLILKLANEQLKDDSIFSNAFGMCEWDGDEWTEWYDDEGNDVDDISPRRESDERERANEC